jgi:hypothetical protein
MRLILSLNHDHEIGRAEARRQAEIQAQRRRANRAKKLEQCKNHIFTSVRRGVAFLIMMAVITYAFSHQEEIQKLINTKLNHVIAVRNKAAQSNMLRQGAIKHENEVNQIIQ